jgi:GH15 family glucan-1,4-alpha-glucosidase
MTTRSTQTSSNGYKPIEDYGVIGDLHTVALVGVDGSIDWCCLPNFDSPSVFGAILDARKGGYFKIAPVNPAVQKQMYLPESCVLVTRSLSGDGVGEVIDFMPVAGEADDNGQGHRIVRIARVVRGVVPFKLECHPAFDYARGSHKLKVESDGALFESSGVKLGLTSPVPLKGSGTGVEAEFVLRAGEELTFVLRHCEPGLEDPLLTPNYGGRQSFDQTIDFWRRWLAGCRYQGRWREMVQRSALTLKLLTFAPTGAIVAAPTTSLPEAIGGVRNWDYRYMWIRDAAFTVYGFIRLGLTREAEHFTQWIEARAQEEASDGSLQHVYGIHGEHDLTEHELPHLEGYRGSSPVRIGNQAYTQLQLDIYGELMDSVYLSNKYGKPISYDLWQHLRRLLDFVCANWQLKDEGIWEVRGGKQHFVYSKLMSWVALDRGLRLADKRSFPADRTNWLAVRDQIYEEIMKRGWSEKRNSFVQHYDTDALDASNLIMPLTFFISPTDPRMLSTIDATLDTLVSDSLVYRYQIGKGAEDGFEGGEGTFSMCSFWLVEALTRAGRLDEARLMFEKMLTYANHLGLYAEEIGHSGEALGNFPQAFTHMGLISAAFNLNRALGD